jgi:DNA mismatch repair ATPase MutS
MRNAGMSVADGRLAGLPKDVLEMAQQKADQLKVETDRRLMASLARRTKLLLEDRDDGIRDPLAILKNALILHKSLTRKGYL